MAGHIGPAGLVGQMPEARSSEVRYRNGIRLVEAMGGIAERNLELALPFERHAEQASPRRTSSGVSGPLMWSKPPASRAPNWWAWKVSASASPSSRESSRRPSPVVACGGRSMVT